MAHVGVADLLVDPPSQSSQPDAAADALQTVATASYQRLQRLHKAISIHPDHAPDPLNALLDGSVPAAEAGTDFGLLDAFGQPFVDGRHLIDPDIAICPHCLGDVFDPDNRRYGYPFTNCSQCGPRFSIIESQPYDRAHTTMGEFAMCVECASEFLSLSSRWYHAQPQGCPECGPRIWFVDNAAMTDQESPGNWPDLEPNAPRHFSVQQPVDVNPDIGAGVDLLRREGILAVKGMGGFHLFCLATDVRAVGRLRRSKEQVHRPLSIMVRNVAEAEAYCHVSPTERTLLTAPEGPVVLLRKRADGGASDAQPLAPSIAENSGDIGVMLPHSALSHILIQAVGAPLVITSGNRPGEPICIQNGQAWQALRHMCDGFLFHNLNLVHPCEDTVLFVWNESVQNEFVQNEFAQNEFVQNELAQNAEGKGQPRPRRQPSRRLGGAEKGSIHRVPGVQITRRSRGMVPLPVSLPKGMFLDRPILAVGADRRNVAALAADDQVFLTQHLGELNNPNARHMHRQTVSNFEWLFQIRPQVAVCDLHPRAISSLMANDWAEIKGQPVVRVQHHHAHIAACLADNGHTGPAIGLCFDDLGYGPDGSFWGGEVMVADLAEYERRFHLEPVHLPGGEYTDAPSCHIAVAYLRALVPDLPLEQIPDLLPKVSLADVEAIEEMRLRGQNVARTSSMARLCHAVGAFLGLCRNTDSSRVIQAIRTLESQAVRGQERAAYPVELKKKRIQLGAFLSALVADQLAGVPTADIALAFFVTLAEIALVAAEQVRADLLAEGLVSTKCAETVALAGEVWQSRLLLQLTVPRLQAAGFTVLLPDAVPGTDAGIAYGQVVVAAARMKKGRNG
jgi:hydrogenase maturation protein HypF